MQHTTPEYHQNQILLRQSSPVAMAHEEPDTILDQYIDWLTMERPDRVTQFVDARQVLRRQFIDIDQIKDQSEKQLADLGIPIGIVGLLRRYIHDFKVWRRNPSRSRVTPHHQLITPSNPVAKLVSKRGIDTDLLAGARYRGFVDIDDLNETQSIDEDYESGLEVEGQLTQESV